MQRVSGWLLIVALVFPALAQVNPHVHAGLHWRLIGPWRGGKATSVVGVAGDPAVYYMGTAGGGAWRTRDGGRTWQNFSDNVRLTGIGAVAAASSGLVLVGAAGQGERNGLYRSTAGGDGLALVGLGGHAVASIALDPENPEVALAAADSGVVRSSDGGRTWEMVLPSTRAGGGAADLAPAPDDFEIVYASFRPAFGGFAGRGGTGGDPNVFRSSDGGASWTATAGAGLPPRGRGTVGLAVAPGTQGRRVYATMAQGVYRSDDGGASWRRATDDPRLIGGGQFHSIYVDPTRANILYAMQTSCYRSTDGGATWESFTGAPSGDDFNAFWMDPTRPLNMALAVDQGTEISMNGGHTWTTWYNQPTGQMYNVSTDHGFPFFMYASQQDSGTVAVPIRANDGQITYRDWYTTNGFESARITPDPLHPDILFVTGWYGSVLRVDHTTGQSVHVFERNPRYREAGSPAMEFSPQDLHTLYLATQYVLATQDGGQNWKAISPDLTAGAQTPAGRGGGPAISTLAPSPLKAGTIWAGTSNGLIQLTQNGGRSWRNVTPAGGVGGISMIEAGHRDPAVAYAVVAGPRRFIFGSGAVAKGPTAVDTPHLTRVAPVGRLAPWLRFPAGGARSAHGASGLPPPAIYRTFDNGRTWQPLTEGLPAGVHAVREDPVNPSLLFAAADSGVFVSFDTGAHWQSLELNLPNASCRDLAIEQNDLVVATFGRGLWALDDIGSLRQMSDIAAEAAGVRLFRPTPAIRMQWDTYTDTPLNPETPHSENPPDGAILDYYLQTSSPSPLRLSIYDAKGGLVRSFSSQEPTSLPYKINVPDYWLAPPALLPNRAGLNRFVWNLRYPDPPYLLYTYFGVHTDYYEYTLADHAIDHNTPWREPQGPMVLPGRYTVKLEVNGQTYAQSLMVTLDSRLTAVTPADLQRQLGTAQELVAGLEGTVAGYDQAQAALKTAADKATEITAVMNQLGAIDRDQARMLTAVTQADAAPGEEVEQTVAGLCQQYNAAAKHWNQVKPSASPGLADLHCATHY